MKKIKLLAPILGAVGCVGAIAPIATACSASNVNKVVLQEGQSLSRTVTGNSATLAFYFKQENAQNPESTKVYLKDFAINGLSGLKAPDKTIKFVADSAGNMRVTIDVEAIYRSWSNVETISCTLVFRNKKAGTSYEVGPITITIPEEGSGGSSSGTTEEAKAASSISVTIDGAEDQDFATESFGFDNNSVLVTVTLPEDENKFMPINDTLVKTEITITENDSYTYEEGQDYLYFTDGAKTGYFWLANTKSEANSIVIDITTTDNAVPARASIPFTCSNSSRAFDHNVMKIGEGESIISTVSLDNISESHINANLCGYNNDHEWFITQLCESFTMSDIIGDKMAEYVSKLFEANVDQKTACLLLKFKVVMKNGDTYCSSCGFQVYKDSAEGENVPVDDGKEMEDK